MALFQRWQVPGGVYSHGYLLLPAVAYLLYCRWPTIAASVAPSWFWGVCAVAGSILWWMAYSVQVLIVQQALLPLLLLACIGAWHGWHGARAAALPVSLLYLAVPLWNPLQPPLQALTLAVCDPVLDMLSISAHIEASYIQLPSGTLQVARECSGLGFLLVAVAFSVVGCTLYVKRPGRRLLLFAAAVLVALVSNWLRVLALVLIGYYSGMESSLIGNHNSLGWVIFAVASVPLIMLTLRLADPPAPEPPAAPVAAPPATAYLLIPILGLVALVPSIAYAVAAQEPDPARMARLQQLAQEPLPPTNAPGIAWTPAFHHSDLAIQKALRTAEGAAIMHLVWYGTQEQNKKLSYYRNSLADGDFWRTVDNRRERSAQALPAYYEAVIVSPRDERRLIWYWYQAGSFPAAGFADLKLAQLQATLQGRPDAALVALEAPCATSCEAAGEALALALPQALRLTETVLD